MASGKLDSKVTNKVVTWSQTISGLAQGWPYERTFFASSPMPPTPTHSKVAFLDKLVSRTVNNPICAPKMAPKAATTARTPRETEGYLERRFGSLFTLRCQDAVVRFGEYKRQLDQAYQDV